MLRWSVRIVLLLALLLFAAGAQASERYDARDPNSLMLMTSGMSTSEQVQFIQDFELLVYLHGGGTGEAGIGDGSGVLNGYTVEKVRAEIALAPGYIKEKNARFIKSTIAKMDQEGGHEACIYRNRFGLYGPPLEYLNPYDRCKRYSREALREMLGDPDGQGSATPTAPAASGSPSRIDDAGAPAPNPATGQVIAQPNLALPKAIVVGSPQMTDLGGGVLRQAGSGLQWARQDNGGDIGWAGARAYCKGMGTAGGGWRLPKVEELRSIVDSNVEFRMAGKAPVRVSPLFSLSDQCAWSSNAEIAGNFVVSATRVALMSGVAAKAAPGITSGLRALCVRDSPGDAASQGH